jgi:trimeric autotransporter adhesin
VTTGRARATLLGVSWLLASGCGTGDEGTGPCRITAAEVQPSPILLVVGGSLTARVRTTAENCVPPNLVVLWSIADTSIATVNAEGLVTSRRSGATVLRAVVGVVTATAEVRVTASVASVAVDPASATMAAGTTVRLRATARDVLGNVLPDRAVTFLSSAPAIATVSDSGLVTGLTAGRVRVTASVEGTTGASDITVTANPVATVHVTPASPLVAVGDKLAMTATTRDASGAALIGRVVTWRSTTPSVAAVDPNTGLLTAASVGVTTVVATAEGVSASTVVSTGVPSAFDGTWRGSAGTGRPFTMTVTLGRIASVNIGVGIPSGAPCPLTYVAAPLTLVAANQFSFTTFGSPSAATVSGSFLSTTSAQGAYSTVTFDKFICPPSLEVTGTVPGGTWSASRP